MDPLTDRIRQGLEQERWRLPADEDLLSRVHTGATRRRRRRGAAGVAASVLVLAGLAGGGAYVLDGVSGGGNVTAADGEQKAAPSDKATAPETAGTLTGPGDGAGDGSQGDAESGQEPSQDESSEDANNSRQPDPDEEIPSRFRPTSFTAISTEVYWVLGTTATDDENTPLVRTDNGGNDFGVVGKVPAPPAPRNSEPTSQSVTNVRFIDGDNGWAYGNALWATHDGGASWTEITEVPGDVQLLEATDGHAYAIANDDGTYSLWRTPADEEDWEQRATLNNPSDLAAVSGMVVVADRSEEGARDGDGARLVVSTDSGESFTSNESPCTGSLGAGTVSATANSLWLACPTGTSATIRVSTDAGQSWQRVQPSESLSNSGVTIGARDAKNLVAATTDEVIRLRIDGSIDRTTVEGLTAPQYVGFTTPSVGYAIGGNGELYRTTDAGANWNRVSVQ